MLSPTYRQRAARALFGSARSELAPAVLWLGWLDNTDTELTTERVRVENTDTVFGPTTDGVMNVATIDGGVAESAWTLSGVGFWDSATGGELVVSAVLPAAQTVAEDEPLVIDAGTLVLTVA